jgi:hypothetical protein
MDFDNLKTVVINQLKDLTPINSLKVQNHLYGCFIIMEDIAQASIDLSDTVLYNSKYSFDINKQFSEIGIRYGFVMDTKLILDDFNKEYKDIWIQYFKDIDLERDIERVDTIEDCLIQVVQDYTRKEDAFFLNATNTGSLTQEWVDKVLKLLNPPQEQEEVIIKTHISTASIEKPTKKRFANTRRVHTKPVAPKKSLAKTRRHIK